jgi:hypothetical protein
LWLPVDSTAKGAYRFPVVNITLNDFLADAQTGVMDDRSQDAQLLTTSCTLRRARQGKAATPAET